MGVRATDRGPEITMTYRDILLPLFTYPEPSPEGAMSAAAQMARRLGCGADEAEVTALTLEIRLAPSRNRLANLLAGMDDLVRQENLRCFNSAQDVGEAWTRVAAGHGIRTRARTLTTEAFAERSALATEARVHDICLFPIGPTLTIDRTAAEVVLFGSGRPILAFPEAMPSDGSTRFHRVVVAWDGTRAAARALADARPLLASADRIQILSVLKEKKSVQTGQGLAAVDHLGRLGLTAEAVEVSADGAPIGDVLRSFMQQSGSDLLVMGGFGHGRLREFILGGATVSLLDNPGHPVLMSQ